MFAIIVDKTLQWLILVVTMDKNDANTFYAMLWSCYVFGLRVLNLYAAC